MSGRAAAWPRPTPLGEAAWLWTLGDRVDPDLSRQVLRGFHHLMQARADGHLPARDVVPACCALAVHFDPLAVDADTLAEQVQALLNEAGQQPPPPPEQEAAPLALPVVYDGVDLHDVARQTGCPVHEVVRRHAAPTYRVAAIGFRPHFPYLLGLDPALHLPRRSTPRRRVPAGSVAIAGQQTGVYPQESPGGWWLLGRTDPGLLEELLPGDTVHFVPS